MVSTTILLQHKRKNIVHTRTKQGPTKKDSEEEVQKMEIDKPIYAPHFRDCFQVDFLDMQNNPQKNIYKVEMKWIMCVEDHASGFIWLKALPSKCTDFVGFELYNIFSNVGYPLILHIDDCQDYTAIDVLKSVKKQFPIVTTVIGRLRNPSDHGSRVKKMLEKIVKQHGNGGKVANWTLILPYVVAALNSEERQDEE